MPSNSQSNLIYVTPLSDKLPHPYFREDADPTRFNIWGKSAIDLNASIDPSQETFVINHGYLNTGGNPGNKYTPKEWIANIARELRKQNPKANIVITDWDSRNPISYPYMPVKVQEVAKELGAFLKKNKVQGSKLTLIGHSLGAQLSGITSAKYIRAKTVVGLDPAGPIYELLPENLRLSASSADNVVAIHTSRFFGYEFPTGTVDVWVNPNRLFQPGAIDPVGNHGYAHTFFTDMLRGRTYGTVDQRFMLNERRRGFWNVDTFSGTATESTIPPTDFVNASADWVVSQFRYRQGGRNVDSAALSARMQAEAQAEIRTLSQRLANGDISLNDWQKEMALALRRHHIAQAILARGGRNRMTQSDYATIQTNLEQEFTYLRQFAEDIHAGRVSRLQLIARANMYANRTSSSYSLMVQQNYRDAGYKYMRRFLSPEAIHCPECYRYASEGFKLIGELPLPTEKCTCRANCKCRVQYYKDSASAE